MSQNRRRLQLILVALVFAAPLLVAFALNLVGWRPQQLRNIGELVQPPRDIAGLKLTDATGTAYALKDPAWRWSVVALTSKDCAERCRRQLEDLAKARLMLTQKAERVRLVTLGQNLTDAQRGALASYTFVDDAAGALSAERPAGDTIAAWVVDPNGLLVLRYAPGFDPMGVRADLNRVLR